MEVFISHLTTQGGSFAIDSSVAVRRKLERTHRNLDEVLHGQEQASLGALVDARMSVMSHGSHRRTISLSPGVTGEGVGHGGLQAVGTHDGVVSPEVDGEVDAREISLDPLRRTMQVT